MLFVLRLIYYSFDTHYVNAFVVGPPDYFYITKEIILRKISIDIKASIIGIHLKILIQESNYRRFGTTKRTRSPSDLRRRTGLL